MESLYAIRGLFTSTTAMDMFAAYTSLAQLVSPLEAKPHLMTLIIPFFAYEVSLRSSGGGGGNASLSDGFLKNHL